MKLKRGLIASLVLCALMVTFGVAVVACTTMSPEERARLIERSAELETSSVTERSRQVAERDRQQQLVDAAQAAGDAQARRDAEAARDKAAKAVTMLDKIIPMIQQGKTVFEASVDPSGNVSFNPAAVAIGTAVGGPIGTGIAIGIPLIMSIISSIGWGKKSIEARDNLVAVESLVKGIDKVSIADKGLSAQLDAAWPTVESVMTPKAIEIVNKTAIT